jgi:hypothetical protein
MGLSCVVVVGVVSVVVVDVVVPVLVDEVVVDAVVVVLVVGAGDFFACPWLAVLVVVVVVFGLPDVVFGLPEAFGPPEVVFGLPCVVVIVVFGDEVVVLGPPWAGAVFGAAPFAVGAPFGPAETGRALRDRMVATLIERSRSRMLVPPGRGGASVVPRELSV